MMAATEAFRLKLEMNCLLGATAAATSCRPLRRSTPPLRDS
jgi:hypothetical protein